MEFSYQDGLITLPETTREGKVLFVSSEPDATPTSTGLGYFLYNGASSYKQMADDDFPEYSPTHLKTGKRIGKYCLPTENLVRRYLEHIYVSDPLLLWTLDLEEMISSYGEARLKDVLKESWRAITTDLIGEENAENMLRYLFSRHGKYFQSNLDSEYYGRLEETLDLLAMHRVQAEWKEEEEEKAKKTREEGR